MEAVENSDGRQTVAEHSAIPCKEDTKSEEIPAKFTCEECGFIVAYDYFGNQPPFLKSFVTLEEAYLMKDPFSSDIGVIVLGSHCSLCHKPVCVSQDCSVFYTRRFCIPCVQSNIEEFPNEIKMELLTRQKKKEPR